MPLAQINATPFTQTSASLVLSQAQPFAPEEYTLRVMSGEGA
jgi:hypothetical protein